MGVDWKKEIKLSDLVRRPTRAKAAAPREEATAPARKRPSLPKRPIRLSLPRPRRARKAAKAAQPAQPPARPARRAAPRPDVPLMRAFNLLPREDRTQTARRRPSSAQLVLAVVALLLVAVLGSLLLVTSAGVAAKRAERDELDARVQELAVAGEAPAEEPLDPALVEEERARTAALSTALGSRVAWDRVLRELSLVLPEDVWLTTLVAARPAPAAEGAPPAAGPTVTINGYTRAQDGVARLLARLAVLPELSSVALVSSTAVELGREDVVQFAITAAVKRPGGAAA